MIKKLSIFFFKFCVAVAGFVALQQLVELKTFGFYLQKIQANDLHDQPRWDIRATPHEVHTVKKLLAQPYRLIGSGSECFAFMSEDGQTVVKFFKLDRMRPVYVKKGLFVEDHSAHAGTLSSHFLTKFTLPHPFHIWLKRFLGIREFRIQRTFSSIKLAYDELKDETGLLYLHLNPTDNLKQTLTIYDGSGIRHEINLDSARFFLQKCAVPLERHFTSLCENAKHNEAKTSIDSLLNLILTRCKKGFADRDLFNKNLGFINTQAIEFDTGSFHKDSRMSEPEHYKQELFYATLELKTWLKKNYPEMVSYLEERVFQEISSA